MNSSSKRIRLPVIEPWGGVDTASLAVARSDNASAQASQSSSTQACNSAARIRHARAVACRSMRLLKARLPCNAIPSVRITRRYSPPLGDSDNTSHPTGTNARPLGRASKGCTRSLPIACRPRWLSKAKPMPAWVATYRVA
ncbi:hypothetical protein D3C85_1248310 [compost metagenome]